jgi:hypothetical protein
MIEDRNLPTGTRLAARHKGHVYHCVVRSRDEDKVGFTLDCPDHPDLHGKEFKSPSSAGSAVMGGVACNGWRFWSLEGQLPERKERKAKEPKEPKAKARSKFRTIKKLPNQQGLEEGQVRYWCSACQKSFVVEGDQEPEACPEGHRNDDPELTA